MQANLYIDIDELAKALQQVRNYIRSLEGEEIDDQEELSASMAAACAEDIIAYLKRSGKPCECSRWKALYQKESEETIKIHRRNQDLLRVIKEKEEQQAKDRIEISNLLSDYLVLFQKQYEIKIQEEPLRKQQSRSKSKNKPSSQTERKSVKPNHNDPHGKPIIQKLNRDLDSLHRQLQQSRDKNIELQQILRIYRTKQRKHLLQGQCKWFQ